MRTDLKVWSSKKAVPQVETTSLGDHITKRRPEDGDRERNSNVGHKRFRSSGAYETLCRDEEERKGKERVSYGTE